MLFNNILLVVVEAQAHYLIEQTIKFDRKDCVLWLYQTLIGVRDLT